jgi:hypothetical protein
MSEYAIKSLGPATWDAFVGLAQKHNGVWGGCWCTWFHPASAEKGLSSEGNRALKERLVREGKSHAALVFDGEVAVAWCQYGSPAELPSIYHLKEYEAGLREKPDYRITCFFVDRNYRRKGVAAVALGGALGLIAKAGGGVVEAIPRTRRARGPRVPSSTTARGVSSSKPASAMSGRRERTTASCGRRFHPSKGLK